MTNPSKFTVDTTAETTVRGKTAKPIGYLNFSIGMIKGGEKKDVSLAKTGIALYKDNPIHLMIIEEMDVNGRTSEELLSLLSVKLHVCEPESDEPIVLAFAPAKKPTKTTKP